MIPKNHEGWGKFVQSSDYAYTTQLHKNANLIDFSFLLSVRPPEPTPVLQPSSLATKIYVKTGTRWLQLGVQQKLAAFLHKAITQKI